MRTVKPSGHRIKRTPSIKRTLFPLFTLNETFITVFIRLTALGAGTLKVGAYSRLSAY